MTRSAAVRGLVLLATMAASAAARPTVSLDGVWAFRFAPDDRGEREGWFRTGVAYPEKLRVPGCWDAQGIGEPTQKTRHNAVGVGWYRRTFSVPADWAHRRVWLRVGGAHRSATVWIDGQRVGEHWGYPVSFRFDVTRLAAPGRQHVMVIAVDSRRHRDRDPLTGTFDILDFMDVDWGGIFEPITLEATDDIHMADVFVQPDPASGRARVQVELGRTEGAKLNGLSVDFGVTRWQADGPAGPALGTGKHSVDGKTPLAWDLDLRAAPLWTPETPHLLTLRLVLSRGDQTLDERSVRFGQRRLEIRGNDFYLNGERFFFRGYGDDFTHPRTFSPPPDVAFWRQYLLRRKAFGLNGVRHHSMMPPESYLAAADEVGILVQPELPIAYGHFFKAATKRGHDLYRYVWQTYIRQMRNHPSVFSWCMNNEMWSGFELAPELYKMAKRLDPTRPVIDADGVGGDLNRPTLDYLTIMFDIRNIPWGQRRGKFQMKDPPKRPVISHETSNISVLPDPADIPKYDGVVRPFWLEQMAEQVRRRGLTGHLPAMLSASRRLQANLIKLNIEAARLGPEVDGHHQWLFRDYWTQSTGVVSQFDEVRALTPETGRQFFGQAVVLWDHDCVNYWAGQSIPLRVFVSDFRPKAAKPRLDQVSITVGDRPATLQPPKGVGGRGLIGPWTGKIAAPAVNAPKKLVVKATAGPIKNQWAIWIFPRSTDEQQAPASGTDVLRTRWLTDAALDRLASGGVVCVMDEDAVFPTLRGRFKPAWWKGSTTADASYGNMIQPHPAMQGFPHDGYGDLQMAGLVDERAVVVTEALPVRIDPIVWCLDVPWEMRRKAYLFEAKVGRGRLLVSAMNLSRPQRQADPAADWLYRRLLAYVRSDAFRPKVDLPMNWLRKRVARVGRPDPATWVEGLGKVLERTEPLSIWYSYREDKASNYVVRQTDGRQKLRWATAVVPADGSGRAVTFVWAGGIGWRSEPGGGHFSLALNGRHVLDFPFAQTTTSWKSKDGAVRLQYMVRRRVGVDSLGLFFLTVPRSQIRPGQPVELTVTATAQKSRRWFGLSPYTDVVAREREEY